MLPVLSCRLEMLSVGLCLAWRRMQAAAQSAGSREVQDQSGACRALLQEAINKAA